MENLNEVAETTPIAEAIQQYKKNIVTRTWGAKEFAKNLGISEMKARQLMRIEGAPVIKIGRERRLIVSKLDDFLLSLVGREL